MPEMPEVRTVSSDMNKLLKNKIIESVEVLRNKTIVGTTPKIFKDELKNAKILSITNIGKWIIFNLKEKYTILSHLRMTGKYFYYKNKEKATKHAHVLINFIDGSQLQFEDYRGFGTMELKNKDTFKDEKPISLLAPEPQNLDSVEFWNKLQKSRRAIKTLILDQSVVLGFGNIYVDETLWELKIHPETPGNKITKKQAEKILEFGAFIMDWSTKLGGSSISTYGSVNNKPGNFAQHLKIFRKNGQRCERCKKIIEKIRVGGRGTHFCPNCQIKHFLN